jgi:hypothetical protein
LLCIEKQSLVERSLQIRLRCPAVLYRFQTGQFQEMASKASRWLRLVDRASGTSLSLVGIGVTVSFALVYWVLTANLPDHGIKGPDGDEFDMIAALYFSVVTETTLGYGDLRPAGASRVIVCLHVLIGLAFAGVVVAKITSAQGTSARLFPIRRVASG